VTETTVSSEALGHVGRVLQRSIGRLPFQHITLVARTDGLEFFHDDGNVETLVHLDADVDVDGQVVVDLRARVFVELLRRLPRGGVKLTCDGAEFGVAASTVSYELVAEPAARLPPALPTDGVVVDELNYRLTSVRTSQGVERNKRWQTKTFRSRRTSI
jgi:DNA polymerase III sliding clamp (beta) subunit (PCNA family)